MVSPLHQHKPRDLSQWDADAITAQCIRVVYPDDMTPCDPKTKEPLECPSAP